MNQATQTLPSVSRTSVVPTTEPAPEDTATVPSGLVAGVFGSVPTWKATPLPPGQLTTGVPLLCVVADVSVSEMLPDCDIDPLTQCPARPGRTAGGRVHGAQVVRTAADPVAAGEHRPDAPAGPGDQPRIGGDAGPALLEGSGRLQLGVRPYRGVVHREAAGVVARPGHVQHPVRGAEQPRGRDGQAGVRGDLGPLRGDGRRCVPGGCGRLRGAGEQDARRGERR